MQIKLKIDHYFEGSYNPNPLLNMQSRTITYIFFDGNDDEIKNYLKHFIVMKSSKDYEGYIYQTYFDCATQIPSNTSITANYNYSITTNLPDGQVIHFDDSGTLSAGQNYKSANTLSMHYLKSGTKTTSEIVEITVTDLDDNPVEFNYWSIPNYSELAVSDSDLQAYCNGQYDDTRVPEGTNYNAPEGHASSDEPPKKDALTDNIKEHNSIYDSNNIDTREDQNFNNDRGDPINVEQQGTVPDAGGMQYNLLNTADVRSFFNWFWNDIFKVESVSDFVFNSVGHLYGDLSNCVLGLKFSPLPLDSAFASTTHKITLGRFESPLSATDAQVGSLQRLIYVSGKMSGLNNNFIDTAPYTNAYWFLPFYGFASCDVNKYLNKNLQFALWADLRTGMARWVIEAELKNGFAPVEQYDFMLFIDQPITLDDGGRILQSLTDSVASTAGTSLGGSVATVANVIGQGIPTAGQLTTQSNCGTLLNTLNSNSIYVIRMVPQYYKPNDMANTVGRACNQTYKVSTLKGFCKFRNVKITYGNTTNSDDIVVYPTQNEMDKIKSQLENGILIERYEVK